MRLVYNSFEGRYSDSPRALYEALRRRGDDHEHVWLADPAHAQGGEPAEALEHLGARHPDETCNGTRRHRRATNVRDASA